MPALSVIKMKLKYEYYTVKYTRFMFGELLIQSINSVMVGLASFSQQKISQSYQ